MKVSVKLWGELAGVWGRGLLAVESVVWALRAGESVVAVALVRSSDRTENMSYRKHELQMCCTSLSVSV